MKTEQLTPQTDFDTLEPDEAKNLARHRIPVRSLAEGDLDAIARIDKRVTGRDRTAYLRRKLDQMINESGVRVSLVAEIDGQVAGFIMAQVDYGEFGQAATTAVIDTIGVDPGLQGRDLGKALVSQLLTNLAYLRVETVRTEVEWSDLGLNRFLHRCGFRVAQRLAFSRRL